MPIQTSPKSSTESTSEQDTITVPDSFPDNMTIRQLLSLIRGQIANNIGPYPYGDRLPTATNVQALSRMRSDISREVIEFFAYRGIYPDVTCDPSSPKQIMISFQGKNGNHRLFLHIDPEETVDKTRHCRLLSVKRIRAVPGYGYVEGWKNRSARDLIWGNESTDYTWILSQVSGLYPKDMDLRSIAAAIEKAKTTILRAYSRAFNTEGEQAEFFTVTYWFHAQQAKAKMAKPMSKFRVEKVMTDKQEMNQLRREAMNAAGHAILADAVAMVYYAEHLGMDPDKCTLSEVVYHIRVLRDFTNNLVMLRDMQRRANQRW